MTATAIELCADRINFVRYGEDGLFSTESVKRLNEAGGSADTGASFESPVVENESRWKTSERFWSFVLKILSMLGFIEF